MLHVNLDEIRHGSESNLLSLEVKEKGDFDFISISHFGATFSLNVC